MSKVLVNETSLTSIADAIREKNGTTETYTPSQMGAAIAAIEVGGGSGEDGVPNPIILTHKTDFLFSKNNLDWLINEYGNRIQTQSIESAKNMFHYTTNIKDVLPFYINSDNTISCENMFRNGSVKLPDDFFTHSGMEYKITSCYYMFYNYEGEKIPSIKQHKTTCGSCNNMFNGTWAKEIGYLELNPDTLSGMFGYAKLLRQCPNITFIGDRFRTDKYASNNQIFRDCYSLRNIPSEVLKNIYNSQTDSSSYSVFNQGFINCYVLESVEGLSPITGTLSSNTFNGTFNNCHRISKITFDKQNNGTPYVAQWKNQTISLYNGIGWLTLMNSVITTDFNSGITDDKKVVSQETYEALKNDADWYTNMPEYSRFNHTSAVELINSLPDTSAYLATQTSGTNTVYLRNIAGQLTDGGSCGSLTEEEIAVAAAKGWTITYKT